MVKYGRDTHQGYKPDIIVFVQVEFYDVIVGESIFFGEIPECSAVKATHTLVRGKPYKPIPVLQALINDSARQPVLHSELPIG
jgi:hypothetical protein